MHINFLHFISDQLLQYITGPIISTILPTDVHLLKVVSQNSKIWSTDAILQPIQSRITNIITTSNWSIVFNNIIVEKF